MQFEKIRQRDKWLCFVVSQNRNWFCDGFLWYIFVTHAHLTLFFFSLFLCLFILTLRNVHLNVWKCEDKVWVNANPRRRKTHRLEWHGCLTFNEFVECSHTQLTFIEFLFINKKSEKIFLRFFLAFPARCEIIFLALIRNVLQEEEKFIHEKKNTHAHENFSG